MKALTIKQPWAQLIVDGIKDIENRSWRTHFRGRVYVHASAKQPKGFTTMLTYGQLEDFHSYVDKPVYGCYVGELLLREPWFASAILGEVDIIDCVQNHPSIWAEKGVWNWVLASPVKYYEPILNIKGKLSFWEPDLSISKNDINTLKK